MTYRVFLESEVYWNATLANPPESIEAAFEYFKAANQCQDDPVTGVVELLNLIESK
jgi:hypothetical protein